MLEILLTIENLTGGGKKPILTWGIFNSDDKMDNISIKQPISEEMMDVNDNIKCVNSINFRVLFKVVIVLISLVPLFFDHS